MSAEESAANPEESRIFTVMCTRCKGIRRIANIVGSDLDCRFLSF